MILRVRCDTGGPFYLEVTEDEACRLDKILGEPRVFWIDLGGVLIHRTKIRYVARLHELPAGEHLVTEPPARPVKEYAA